MERPELIRALQESFHSFPRPRSDTARGRAWLDASRAIELVAIQSPQELVAPLSAIVRACRKLGAIEAAAYAAALGGALRLDLGSVYADDSCDDCA